MIYIGMAIAVALLALDAFLRSSGSRFRTPVMPVAVGIYLPLGLSAPIFLGGLLAHGLSRHGEAARNRGVLIGSGLIAGEAMAGILIALLIYVSGESYPLWDDRGDWLSLAAFAAVGWLIWRNSIKQSVPE